MQSIGVHTHILTLSLRHGLVYGLDAIAHGELIHDVLLHLVKVNLPRIVSLSHWDLHHAASLHIGREVERVLQRKRLREQENISRAQRSEEVSNDSELKRSGFKGCRKIITVKYNSDIWGTSTEKLSTSGNFVNFLFFSLHVSSLKHQ